MRSPPHTTWRPKEATPSCQWIVRSSPRVALREQELRADKEFLRVCTAAAQGAGWAVLMFAEPKLLADRELVPPSGEARNAVIHAMCSHVQ